MLRRTCMIDSDHSFGTFCSIDNIVFHNWTNFINVSKYCRDNYLTVDINKWLGSKEIIAETCNWIKTKYSKRPTFLSPHGSNVTQGLYIHPMLFELFVVDIGGMDIYEPVNFVVLDEPQQATSTSKYNQEFNVHELNSLITNLNKVLVKSIKEKEELDRKIALNKLEQFVYTNDSELLDKKYMNNIKRQISELAKNLK